MKEIEFTINPDGTVEIDQIGWGGEGCHQVAEDLVKVLGTKVKQTKKIDYYAQHVTGKTVAKAKNRG